MKFLKRNASGCVAVVIAVITMGVMIWPLPLPVLAQAGHGGGGGAGKVEFGMIGITHADVLRLNIVAIPPNPCVADLGFFDSNGRSIGPSADVALPPGHATFLDLPGTVVVPSGPNAGPNARVEVRPSVVPTPAASFAGCVATVEVFNPRTGTTLIITNPAGVSFGGGGGAGKVKFGEIGFTRGQVLRLNIVAKPPNPCHATLGFADSNDSVIGPMPETVALEPGHATFLDLPGTVVVPLGPHNRVEVRPVVEIIGGECVTSAEVYRRTTKETQVFLNPQPLPPSPGPIGTGVP